MGGSWMRWLLASMVAVTLVVLTSPARFAASTSPMNREAGINRGYPRAVVVDVHTGDVLSIQRVDH